MQNKKTASSPNSFLAPAIRWVAVAALSYCVFAAPLFAGDELTSIIAKGKPPMPAFDKSLDAAAIEDLVASIRAIKN
jgi:hypothetical protein